MTNSVYATAVDIAGKGVLLFGPSGAGKSDVALRLIDRGAVLIADDQVALDGTARGLRVTAPPISQDLVGGVSMRGYIEIRGLGVVSVPVCGFTLVALAVELAPRAEVPRLPTRFYKEICGYKIPCVQLHAFDVSTPIKIELAIADCCRIGSEGPLRSVTKSQEKG